MCMQHECFNVLDYGAIGDGVALDSVAIQATIERAAEVCGTVYFPMGTYRCGSLILRNNLTMHFSSGAKVLASGNPADYREDTSIPESSGLRGYLFDGDSVENVVFEGSGLIDGNGYAFWEENPSPTSKVLRKKKWRPALFYLKNCSHILIRDIRIANAPAYTIWLLGCENARIEGVTIRNPRNGPNTDALDIDCCRNVMISNCNIDAGDDCIALKSDASRAGHKQPCENIVVTNCVLSSLTCGIRIGYEADEPIRDCAFSNLVIYNSRKGIDMLSVQPDCPFTAIKKGTPIDQIVFSNIVMRNVQRAIHIYAGNVADGAGTYDAAITNVSFSNIQATTCGASCIACTDGKYISNLLLRDITIRQQMADLDEDLSKPREMPISCWGHGYLPWSLILRKIKGIKLENVSISRDFEGAEKGGCIQWADVDDFSIDGQKKAASGHIR